MVSNPSLLTIHTPKRWLASGLFVLALAGCDSEGSFDPTLPTDPIPTDTAELEAWVGTESSELTLSLSDSLTGADFYASSDADCAIENSSLCNNPGCKPT